MLLGCLRARTDDGECEHIWRKQREVEVVVIPNAMHYIFLSNEAEIVSPITRFVDGLPHSKPSK